MSVDETLMCSFQILKPSEKKTKYQYGGMSTGRPVTPPRAATLNAQPGGAQPVGGSNLSTSPNSMMNQMPSNNNNNNSNNINALKGKK
jgi:hypothetical protein